MSNELYDTRFMTKKDIFGLIQKFKIFYGVCVLVIPL